MFYKNSCSIKQELKPWILQLHSHQELTSLRPLDNAYSHTQAFVKPIQAVNVQGSSTLKYRNKEMAVAEQNKRENCSEKLRAF